MRWMLDIQLGRRNLSPIQRIAVAEKYRPIYEKQAKERQTKYYGNQYDKRNAIPSNLTEVQTTKNRENETNSKLADIAGVKPTTYKMGAKVLNSDNDELKQRVLSGETSISAGYKELIQGKNEKKSNTDREVNNVSSSTTTKQTTPKAPISEETKQICADLKTEKTKEYLDSIWDYKVAIIECMLADFEQNIFRLAIRNYESTDNVHIWTFYNTDDYLYSELSAMIEDRYKPYGALFEYEDTPEELKIEKVKDRKPPNGKKMTNAQKIIKWREQLTKGTEYKIQTLLKETGLTDKQLQKTYRINS